MIRLSHTVYAALNGSEKDERLRLLHEQTIGLKQQIEKLKKSAIAASKEGITVDEEFNVSRRQLSTNLLGSANKSCIIEQQLLYALASTLH